MSTHGCTGNPCFICGSDGSMPTLGTFWFVPNPKLSDEDIKRIAREIKEISKFKE